MLHLVIAGLIKTVSIISSQVNDVVDREANDNDDGDGLRNAELPVLEVHDGQH